jgi:formylglycine-generating enzyme required for sulfatase activity
VVECVSAKQLLDRYLDDWRKIYKIACDPNEVEVLASDESRLRNRIEPIKSLRLDRYIWPVLKWRKGYRRGEGAQAVSRRREEYDPTDMLDESWSVVSVESHSAQRFSTTNAQDSLINTPGRVRLRRLLDRLGKDRLLVCHQNAGMGKTAFSHMLFRNLLEGIDGAAAIVVRLEGVWPRFVDDKPLSLMDILCDEIAGKRINGVAKVDAEDFSVNIAAIPTLDDVRAVIRQALQAKRVYVVVDGLDQFSDADRDAAIKEITNARRPQNTSSTSHCQWIVLGRPYSIQKYCGDNALFDRGVYHVRIEPFDTHQQDEYFSDLNQQQGVRGNVLDSVCSDRKKMGRDLGIPLHLSEIRYLVELALEAGSELPCIDSVPELYLLISDTILRRIIKSGFVDIEMLRQVCGVLAIEMLVARNWDAIVYGNLKVKTYLEGCKNRFLRSAVSFGEAEQQRIWEEAVRILETEEFTQRLELDCFGPKCRSFRTRKTMEWYAAHYLANHITDEDLDGIDGDESSGAIVDLFGDDQWFRCFELATQMPERSMTWSSIFRVCKRLFSEPKKGKTRPCYEMYLAFERWLHREQNSERQRAEAAEVIQKYQSKFKELVLAEDPVANSIIKGFKSIPAGEFAMGSPEGEVERDVCETQHLVRITKLYCIHEFPVTNAQYELFDSVHQRCLASDRDDQPVVNVSWYEAYCFSRWVSDSRGRIRLPTEAEWEYACRGAAEKANESKAFWFGNVESELVKHAWYSANSGGKTHSLEESKRKGGHANQFELVDMHGNVWEWCNDWIGDYDLGNAVDPIGPRTGSFRVHRGGGWNFQASVCRSADRDWSDPSNRYNNLGFRLLLSPSVK